MSNDNFFSSVITQEGLSCVTSASPLGPLISIAYFLPVFDERYDGSLFADNTPLSAVSACAQDTWDRNLTAPYGEILYNTSESYDLSSGISYIISGANVISSGGGNYSYSSPIQNQIVPTNLKDGVPLHDQVYGNWIYDSNTNSWSITDGSGVAVTGNDDRPLNTTADFFNTVDYYPIELSGSDSLRGSWKCRLYGNNLGKFKFNKIALYAVTRNVDGTIHNGTPVFFAESYFTEPIVKTSLQNGQGYDDIVVEAQLEISTVTSAFNNIFYSTSGDYFQKAIHGLHYSEKVLIGTTEDITSEPQAMLHIRRSLPSYPDTSATPQLRLDYDASDYATQECVSSSAADYSIYKLTAYHKSGGVLDVSEPLCLKSPGCQTGALYPENNEGLDLGMIDKQYSNLYSISVHTGNIDNPLGDSISFQDNIGMNNKSISAVGELDATTVNADVALTRQLYVSDSIFASSASMEIKNLTAQNIDGVQSFSGTNVSGTNGYFGNIISPTILALGRGMIDGCQLACNNAPYQNYLIIGAGVAMSEDNTTIMTTDGSLIKRIDTVWAASSIGTPRGGWPSVLTSATPSTWTHVFIVGNPNTGAVDGGFDTAVNGANLLRDTSGSGYTKLRRVGSIFYNDSAVISPFTQIADYFYLRAGSQPYSQSITTSTHSGPITLTIAPTGLVNKLNLGVQVESGAAYVRFGDGSSSLVPFKIMTDASSPNQQLILTCDSNNTINYILATNVSTVFDFVLGGWWDRRGKN